MSDRIDEYHGADAKVLTTDEVERWQEFLGDGIQLRRTLATTRALETARAALVDVHDALHRECAGKADLPGEIRALRARAEKAERERDEARAEVERRDALISRDGYEDMRQHAADLAQRLEKAERERDEARATVADLVDASERLLEHYSDGIPDHLVEEFRAALAKAKGTK